MPSLIRATCLMATLIAILATADPVLAQQTPATKFEVAKLTRRNATPAPFETAPAEGYMKTCGRHFVCYTGIPLNCTPQTRPYENVAEHQCFCVHDGCPQ